MSDRRTAIAARLLGAAAVAVVLLGAVVHFAALAGAATAADPDRPDRTVSGQVQPSTDPQLPPALGPYPAKVVVVVYSDFQCPVCARVTDATHQIAEEFPSEVRVEFHQHALAMHANAEAAAIASLAAHRQGRFWEMHDALFAHQDALDPASLAVYARDVGLDLERFRRDVADPTLRDRVRREGALAEQLEAAGTPAFVINGRVHVGWGSWIGFRGLVEQELGAVNALVAEGASLTAAATARARANAKDEAAFLVYERGIAPTARGVAAGPRGITAAAARATAAPVAGTGTSQRH